MGTGLPGHGFVLKAECEAWIVEMHAKYAAGTLTTQQIKRINQIKGWSWSEPKTGCPLNQ